VFAPWAKDGKYCSQGCKWNASIGDRVIDTTGYARVRVPRNTPGAFANGWMLEHRYAMQQHLGRPLERWETIHHVNGIKHDNRIENLQIRQGKHGAGLAYVCLDCGSHNVKSVTLT
jgi:hypothetical protein